MASPEPSHGDGDRAGPGRRTGGPGRDWRVLRWLGVVLAAGVGAGLVGAALAWSLLEIQGVAYGSHSESLLAEIRDAAPVRRVLAPTVGGLLAGLGWWWLRRSGPDRDVEDAITDPGRLGVRRPFIEAGLQILFVGAGASIGREGAPRLAAAAVGDTLAARLGLSSQLATGVVAAGAGAGLAAVYNVPLAGVVFAIEILLGWRRFRALAAAMPMSVIATVVAWPVVTNRPTYSFPDVPARPSALAWAVLAIPLCGALGALFRDAARNAVRARTSATWRLPLSVAGAGAVVGTASVWLPMLPGNGKDLTQVAFEYGGSLLLFVVLMLVKPAVTVLCLRSGANGGLLTPALALGAALGAAAAYGLTPLHVGADVAVFALIGACGVLAVGQGAPVFAATMTWELTRAPLWTVPLLLAVAFGSQAMARWMRSRRRR